MTGDDQAVYTECVTGTKDRTEVAVVGRTVEQCDERCFGKLNTGKIIIFHFDDSQQFGCILFAAEFCEQIGAQSVIDGSMYRVQLIFSPIGELAVSIISERDDLPSVFYCVIDIAYAFHEEFAVLKTLVAVGF